MSTLSLILVCVGVLAVNVGALSDEDRSAIKAATFPLVAQCAKEHNMKEEDLKAAKQAVSVAGLDPCFLKCFLLKLGVVDNSGFFDLEAMKDKSKALIKNQDDRDKFESIGKICLAVNDKAVGDGSKGCERAKLALECFIDNKADFTPFTA